MKKRYIFFIVIILFLFFSINLFRLRENFSFGNNSENPNGEERVKVNETTYFSLVTKFKSYTQNLSSAELSTKEITALNTDKDNLESLNLKLNFVDSVDQIYEAVNSSDSSFGILPFEDLEVRFKVVTIDGKSLFSEDLASYPLINNSQYELLKSEAEENFPGQDLSTGEITTSNLDSQKLTTFFGAGEIITGRGVDIKWLQLSNNNFEFLFDRVKNDMKSADLAIALLEHSYYGNPTPCPLCTQFVGDEALIPQLKNVGIDILSLAGNHLGDGGVLAESRTRELLDQNGIKHFGAGENLEEAAEPEIVEVNGITYAFLGADDIATYDWATSTSAGANRFSKEGEVIDSEKIKTDIEKAKSMADKVIVYMSWGVEYTNFATEHQQDMAHEIIDAGADLIISSHVHWIQNMEIYKDKLIVYGFGNFIFDQTHTDPTRESIYVNFHFLEGNLINIEVVPLLACGYHFGARNLAYEVINGSLSYEEVDSRNEAKECVWLQPKPLTESHPKYKVILDRLFEYTEF